MQERPWHASYDEGLGAEIDFEELPIPGFLARSALEHADRPAFHFLNTTWKYGRLAEEVARLATALAGLGVEKGTRVAIQMPNLPQAVIGYYAVLSLGGTAVMTNPLYTPRELEHQWHDANCEVALVADFIYAGTLQPIRDKLPIRHYVLASIPEYMSAPLKWIAPFALRKKSPPAIAKVGQRMPVRAERRHAVEQALGIGMFGIAEIGRRQFLDDLAGIHDDDPVAEGRDQPQVMRDEDQAHAAIGHQLVENAKHFELHRDVERRGRFVGR